MGNLPSGKRRKSLIGLWFEPETAEKFRALAKSEHRDLSQQMELILSDWFAQREKPKTPKVYGPGEYPPVGEETGDTVIWPTMRPVSKVHPPPRPIKSHAPRTHGGH